MDSIDIAEMHRCFLAKRDAADDMYNALWEAVELSDRTLPPSGRTAECQRVYDLCRAALKRAEGE